jgi:hypothetical protein
MATLCRWYKVQHSFQIVNASYKLDENLYHMRNKDSCGKHNFSELYVACTTVVEYSSDRPQLLEELW